MTATFATVYKEYGELPNADHELGLMWVVGYFDAKGDQVDTTCHKTFTRACEAAALINVEDDDH